MDLKINVVDTVGVTDNTTVKQDETSELDISTKSNVVVDEELKIKLAKILFEKKKGLKEGVDLVSIAKKIN